MDTSFFLGANTGRGFVSAMDRFPPDGAFLHIVKGGPGTGKSSYMKTIREAARGRGLDTVSILCSGDPDSLDGLWLPALKQAWVDGTAPHVREPGIFGADSDYVNLGYFCRTPFRKEDQAAAREKSAAYKACYAKAYRSLREAMERERAAEKGPGAGEQRLAEREILARIGDCGSKAGGSGMAFHCWISAISCKGLLRLEESITKLCKQIYVIPSGCAEALELAAHEALDRGMRVIVCAEVLDPERAEALLLPEAGICFAAERRETGLCGENLEPALEALREAKALHDELEAISRPYMDFDALTAFTEETLTRVFP